MNQHVRTKKRTTSFYLIPSRRSNKLWISRSKTHKPFRSKISKKTSTQKWQTSCKKFKKAPNSKDQSIPISLWNVFYYELYTVFHIKKSRLRLAIPSSYLSKLVSITTLLSFFDSTWCPLGRYSRFSSRNHCKTLTYDIPTQTRELQ